MGPHDARTAGYKVATKAMQCDNGTKERYILQGSVTNFFLSGVELQQSFPLIVKAIDTSKKILVHQRTPEIMVLVPCNMT